MLENTSNISTPSLGDLSAPSSGLVESQSSPIPSMPTTMTTTPASSTPVSLASEESSVFKEEAPTKAQPVAPSPDEQVLHDFREKCRESEKALKSSSSIVIIIGRQRVRPGVLSREDRLRKRNRSRSASPGGQFFFITRRFFYLYH